MGTLALKSPEISPWRFSEERWVARLRARAAELGKPLGVLLTEAGMAPDALNKAPKHGRRLDTFERLAKVCEWSLGEAMGFEEPETAVDLMVRALQITRRGLRKLPLNDQLEGETIARVYDILAERRRRGLPIDDQVVGSVADAIAKFVVGKEPA
jgi:hypothetical protein